MTRPESMAGGGQYNDHSTAQSSAGALADPLLRTAARAAPVRIDRSITVADYGCSEGRNSLAPMRAVIDELRSAHPVETPISVVHTDLPDNDFASLFATVADDPLTYAGLGVYSSAVGKSFYGQILPHASVSLGWCSIALHWLSEAPNGIDGVWYTDGTDAQRDGWARQSALDWTTFLDARAAELLPGAPLLIVCGAADATGQSGAESVMALLRHVVDDMAQEGRIDSAVSMSIPAWYRTAAEWQAPFPHAQFSLEAFEELRLGDPIALQHDVDTDRITYACAVSEAIRVSFGPSLLASIAHGDRAEVEREIFAERLTAAIGADPDVGFDWRLVVVALTRR